MLSMRFIINIHLNQAKRIYRIDADDKSQAKERLLLRLHPNKRDSCVIDSITIDPQTVLALEPFGTFTQE